MFRKKLQFESCAAKILLGVVGDPVDDVVSAAVHRVYQELSVNLHKGGQISVAHPDPVGSVLFGSPGSGLVKTRSLCLVHKRTPPLRFMLSR